MTLPARNTLAILGAGPVGLEAACAALDHGFDVHVFERGQPGEHVIAWGHEALVTSWEDSVGPLAASRLAAAGRAPAPGGRTGTDLVERVLAPLAALPELRERVHAHAQVVRVGRRGLRAGERAGEPSRADAPFRLLVRDAGGRENFLHAFAVLDATGTYGQPLPAGDGGVPARGETYLAPQLAYHVEDVRGQRRDRHAGRRTLVIGEGLDAVRAVLALAALADEAPGTSVAWIGRGDAPPSIPNDPLPARAERYARAARLASDPGSAVGWIGGAEVEGLEYNSGTHRYRALLRTDGGARSEEGDQVVVLAGFAPDERLCAALPTSLCPFTRAPQGVAEARRTGAPLWSEAALAQPEPGFHVIGAKSFGRVEGFTLEVGYRQASEVVARLALARGVARV